MMKNTRLGFFTISGVMAASLTALIIAGFAFASGGMLFSPGGLNAKTGAALGGVSSHADIAGKCSLCHAPFWSTTSMADKCVVCHTDVAAQWQDPSLLHGMLNKNNPDLACQNCHPDHRGPGSPLIDLSNANFSHDTFGFLLTSHQAKADGSSYSCKDCHAQTYAPPFDQAICPTCHTQIDAVFVQAHIFDFGANCLACHDGVDSFGHNFNHNSVAFRLIGKHAEVPCGQCHVNARTLANLKSTPQDCSSCHTKDDTHQGQLGSDCGSCHTSTGWTPASFDHNLATFKLDGQHVNVACASCHINHVLQGIPSDCNSCHAVKDTHKGRLGTGCGTCHTTAGWTPATMDHNLAAFKLTGKHITATCESCHIDKVYQGTPTDCNACHAVNDSHNGSLGSSCGSCHTTSGWKPSTFDHNSASFKLTGQHVHVACSGCHANNVFNNASTACNSCHAANDTHGGQFGTNCGSCHTTSGWTPATFDHSISGFPLTGAHTNLGCSQCHSGGVYNGLSKACVSCHAEPGIHAGQFGTDCSHCHSTSNWNATFAHTGFALSGGHANLNCSQCHSGGSFSGLSTDCVSCHAEPSVHAGQFGLNCAQCHNTSNWNATFNHPGGCEGNCANHKHATCADCHPVDYSTYTCLKCHDSNKPGN